MKKLSFENLCHSYNDLPSVQDVSFTITDGEVVSLLGPSGCGKSTLLRLAAGLETPQKGVIKQDDEIISSDKYTLDASKRGVGLVFQNYALFPHLTVLENVCYGLNNRRKEAIEIGREVMRDFDILHLGNQFPHELSGGQQQRVALARAVSPSPDMVLLDEPFSGLDTRLRERVRDKLLHVLRDKNIATLMVTHDAEEAMFMSDKIVVLEKGQVAQIGSPLDVYRSPKSSFVATFFGEANQFSALVKDQEIQTVLGPIPAPDMANGAKVDIIIRNENLKVWDDPQTHIETYPFIIMETHLLGSTTLVHLVDEGSQLRHHFHAKIPGLNFFEVGAKVYLSVSPNDVYVFAR